MRSDPRRSLKILAPLAGPLTAMVLALAATAAFGQRALGEEAIVLASTAPGYQTGKLLEEKGPVSVPEEASLSLLFADGRMATLIGPYNGPLADAAMVELAAGNGGQAGGWDYSAIGGTRSAVDTGGKVVRIDLETGGKFCLDRRSGVALSSRSGADMAIIENTETGEAERLPLESGGRSTAWPYALSIEDEARFRMLLDGGHEAELEFALAPRSIDSFSEWLAFLRASDCNQQWQEELETARDRLVPFAIFMTSNHGRLIDLRQGLSLSLYVRANRDGYVYCYAEDQAGSLLPVFPRSTRDAAIEAEQFITVMSGSDAARLAGTLSRGEHSVQCVGAQRDPGRALPPSFREADLNPVPETARTQMLALLQGSDQFAIAHLTLRKSD